MRAIVRSVYGSPSVLRCEDVAVPTPKAGELLVRVRASSINRGDRYVIEGVPEPIRAFTGLLRPKKRGVGMDFAGDVEGLGDGVDDFSVGDAVFGQLDLGEAWAEYVCVPAKLAATKPENASYTEAAAIPLAGFTALQGLRNHARVSPGHRVLINGATGSVGTLAVQIAKALGGDVTAVCGERNVELIRSLGADRVLAYEKQDFTKLDEKFDSILDIVSNHSLSECRKVLEPKGVYVIVGGPEGHWFAPMAPIFKAMLQSPFISQKVANFVGTPNRDDLLVLREMIESGKLRAVISREFPFDQVVDAFRYLTEERPAAKVVLTM